LVKGYPRLPLERAKGKETLLSQWLRETLMSCFQGKWLFGDMPASIKFRVDHEKIK
jgi:hypothetical protein